MYDVVGDYDLIYVGVGVEVLDVGYVGKRFVVGLDG